MADRPLHQRAERALKSSTTGVPRAVEEKGAEAVAEWRADRVNYSIACSLLVLNKHLNRGLDLLERLLDGRRA